jgi:LPS export ABC transporter protein LptC
MKLNLKQVFQSMVTVLTVTLFFSCESNFKEVQKIGISQNEPIGIAENINLRYTDSGKVEAHLISEKMYDYSNLDFPYSEFTEGITLYLYDSKNQKNTIVSDYAIVYDKTNLIDLIGNVVLTTHDGKRLDAQQLYFDQGKEWLFTNKPVKFADNEQIINGNGFDSNMDFTKSRVLEITGIVYIDE